MRAVLALSVLLSSAAVILPAMAAAAQVGAAGPDSARLRALLRDEEPSRITFAVYRLAARGDADLAAIKGLCSHADPYVRRAAVFALGTTEDAAGKALFSKAVRDADAGVRRAAVFALASLERAEGVPLLGGALRDPHPSVRELAATALGRLGGKKANALLRDSLDDTSVRVRRAAVVALGAVGDAQAVAALRTLQKDLGRGVETRDATRTAQALKQGHNFGYEFLTLPDLMARFTADTGVSVFVTDEALMAVALAAEDPANLDSLKVSMWHVKAQTLLDEVTVAAGLAWVIEGRWVIVTPHAYAAFDTPIELEIAGALHRLGDASAATVLKRYAGQKRWGARAEALLKAK